MKSEKMLERCMELALYLSEEERARFDYYQAHTDFDGYGIAGVLSALIHELKADIATETCKSSGKLGALNAAKRIIKSAKNGPRSALYGSWMEGDLQCYCDGYRAVRLREALPTETIPAGTMPMNVSNIVESDRRNMGEVLSLPTIPDLKAHIKIGKVTNKFNNRGDRVEYDFGEGLPLVNAEYLLDMLELLPGCTATAAKHRPELSPIYFEADGGDGILLPVRRDAAKKAS